MILAVALSSGSGSGSGADTLKADSTAVVSVTAPTPSTAALEPCAQVLSALPVQLDGYNPRQVHPYPDEGAPAVAWGDPAIVLQCGVARPKELTEGSAALIVGVGAVNWLPVTGSDATVFTDIDRSVYIQVTVPKAYPQPPLATLSDAIAGVLPAVCEVGNDTPSTSSAPVASPSTSSPPAPNPGASSGPLPPAPGAANLLCTHRP